MVHIYGVTESRRLLTFILAVAKAREGKLVRPVSSSCSLFCSGLLQMVMEQEEGSHYVNMIFKLLLNPFVNVLFVKVSHMAECRCNP